MKFKKKGRSKKKKNSNKSNKGKTIKNNENIPQISFPPKKSKIYKNSSDLKVNVDLSQKPDSNMEFRIIENQGSLRNINNMPVINNNNINYNYNLPNNYQINNQINNQINSQINNQIIIIEGKQCINFNDYELNHMRYSDALLYDKRTYFQYYLSLIKTGNLIYFSFFLKTDYNPNFIKISIFILSICFVFIVNTIFIGDVSIINKDDNFVYQIPKLIYMVIIIGFLTGLIKYIFLTERDIIKLKNAREKGNNSEYTKISNYIRCKFKIYFIIDFILLFFIWYYVGLFCAVYKNTQGYLFKNIFICLAIYLLYPFIISFIPGFFRIPSLKSTKRNKQCFFRLGNIIASI